MLPETQKFTEASERVLVAVKNWRESDREAVADKSNRKVQNREYFERNNLRDAADKLEGRS